jgi:hypothetical protein
VCSLILFPLFATVKNLKQKISYFYVQYLYYTVQSTRLLPQKVFRFHKKIVCQNEGVRHGIRAGIPRNFTNFAEFCVLHQKFRIPPRVYKTTSVDTLVRTHSCRVCFTTNRIRNEKPNKNFIHIPLKKNIYR